MGGLLLLRGKPPPKRPKVATQVELYRGDPNRHIDPLCSAVAAAVLGDGARGAAVRAEVEKELERWGR